jgi:peptidoglycan hydrolase CwlO-like protein
VPPVLRERVRTVYGFRAESGLIPQLRAVPRPPRSRQVLSEGTATHDHRHLRAIGTVVVAALLTCAFPTVASGASSAAIRTTLATRRAQAAAAEARLTVVRDQLTNALQQASDAELVLEAARQDLATTDATLAQLQGQIDDRQSALNDRAVALYQTGGVGMLQSLLSVASLDDLFTRLDLFSYIQQSDAQLVSGLTVSRNQSETLQQQQALREADLVSLRQQAAATAAGVTAAVAAQEQITNSLSASVATLAKQEKAAAAAEAAAAAAKSAGPAPPVPYDPNTIMSDSAFLDSGSMGVADVQAFLNAHGSCLRNYTGPDPSGLRASAAQMIVDAANAWQVSPRVILVTLEKEQSLISRSTPTAYALDWAMGCGKMDSGTLYQYQGFGNQIWGGARALHQNRNAWHSGISLTIDGAAVYPSNAATFTLYRYTPHFHGNTSFWRLYWSYFGDSVK